MIVRIWMNFRIQLSENLQRVYKLLLTAQDRCQRFDESCLQRPQVEKCSSFERDVGGTRYRISKQI